MRSESECKPWRPDFVVIGAMKCGTTTLYHDLAAQPAVCLPDKESNLLLEENPSWRGPEAEPGQFRGEVCPDYTKRPVIEGVAERLPSDCRARFIYLVRNPVERMISHHHFVSTQLPPQNPGMSRDIDEAVRDFSELVEFGRYGYQLEPWVNRFGRNSIRLVRFEDFVTDRAGILEELMEFIGAPFSPGRIRDEEVHNRSLSRPVLSPFWGRVRRNPMYRKLVRPFTTLGLRDRIRKRVLPRAGGEASRPGRDTLERVVPVFRKDLEQLKTLLELESPPWDL